MFAKGGARRTLPPAVAVAIMALLAARSGAAQTTMPQPEIITPASGIEKSEDIGRRAHTNIELMLPSGGLAASIGPQAAPILGWLIETPASLACAYELLTPEAGCNPYKVAKNPTGGSHAIAIVDAYDYPAAASDLKTFDSQFKIAAAKFSVIYGTGSPSGGCTSGAQPRSGAGSGWDLEAALDIEWAHAMAPSAKLYLVEANSNLITDLMNAVAVATKCVQANQEGQVSDSWGSTEFSGETAYDATFTGSAVVYFFAAGDLSTTGNSPGVSYPASSPNVIGVGGTTFSRNQITGNYQSQAVWNVNYPPNGIRIGTGGGPSAYETRPSYQNGIEKIVADARGTPDLGALADPETGVWVYNSTYARPPAAWYPIGGTSLATPVTAGIFNQFGLFYSSSKAALTALYANAGKLRTNYVTNISSGLCGPNGAITTGGYVGGFGSPYDPSWIKATTGLGWNWCTGWGTMHGPK
jgi:kumamolisin